MLKKYILGVLFASLLAAALSITAYAGTWCKGHGADEGRWWYKFDDGTYACDCRLTIDGVEYAFDREGWMIDGSGNAASTAGNVSESGPGASGGSEKGRALVDEACKYIGRGVVPYINGGRSLAGTDCSGFLHIIYGMYGIDLPYTPTDIYTKCRKLSESELQPGDFVFFTKNGGASISHVAIYAGDGCIVHQTNRARNGVFRDRIADMYLDGVTRYYGAGTVLR